MVRKLLISIVGIAVHCAGLAIAADETAVNHGEDLTAPVDRFDLRMQFKSLPDVVKKNETFDDLSQETLTLRSDLIFFNKPDQLALRFDLPLVWNNKPNEQNPDGFTEFSMGDLLMQAIYVRTFNERWAGGIGMRAILPTATGESFGDGKWQLVPTVGIRASLPEISKGSYAGLAVRQFSSVAGSSTRSDISYFQFQPQFNIGLPDQWFVNFSPEIKFNLMTDEWFVPFDIMVGKKFGAHWIASLEYQYGILKEDDSYNQWLEARIGYFF
ncbi:MAG: hypothetical protein H8M99_11635 [Gloeobacteraceae cyanobacterium ES-bin-144]|nr:hypothetical protein [Verrucomicrobiales bacterium]